MDELNIKMERSEESVNLKIEENKLSALNNQEKMDFF